MLGPITDVHDPAALEMAITHVEIAARTIDGDTTSTQAILRIRVDYSHESGTMQATVPIPPIEAGDAQRFTTRTAYRGLGTYRGMAELDLGDTVVARDPLAFDACGPCG